MKCKYCGLDAQIATSRTEVKNDTSAEAQTEVYTVLSYVCRNPQCGSCGKPVGETRHKIYPEETAKGGEHNGKE